MADGGEMQQVAGQLVVASDYRSTLLKRAFGLLGAAQDEVQDFVAAAGLGGSSDAVGDDTMPEGQTSTALVAVPARRTAEAAYASALAVATTPGSIIDLGLSAVDTRTTTARRAVDVLASFQQEIQELLGSFEKQIVGRIVLPHGGPSTSSGRTAAPKEDVLRLAAATTSAAARFRVRAAKAAHMALQAYEASLEQVLHPGQRDVCIFRPVRPRLWQTAQGSPLARAGGSLVSADAPAQHVAVGMHAHGSAAHAFACPPCCGCRRRRRRS
jgi:hypothetical protein